MKPGRRLFCDAYLCVLFQCFMATVAAGHGKIEDALTIHVNSAGVPVSIAYEVRDDATCMGKRQMGYFQGTIPFETNVTIVAPSTSVKFVSFQHPSFPSFAFSSRFSRNTHKNSSSLFLSFSNRVPSEKLYPKLLKPGEQPPAPEKPANEGGIIGLLKKHVSSQPTSHSHTTHTSWFFMTSLFFAFLATHLYSTPRNTHTQWWAVALVLVFMVGKNLF